MEAYDRPNFAEGVYSVKVFIASLCVGISLWHRSVWG